MQIKHVVIYGGGSFGTALGARLSNNFKKITILTNKESVANEINYEHSNHQYLPSIKLNKNITASTQLDILTNTDLIILAVPSSCISNVITTIFDQNVSSNLFILVASKGFIPNSPCLISDYLDKFTDRYAFIGGPNFALELASKSNAYFTLSANNTLLLNEIKQYIRNDNTFLDESNDIIMHQIASSIKNILAINSGILLAKECGENELAASLAQGLKEIISISGKIKKARNISLADQFNHSIASFAVVGDLILTGSSKTSRNTQFGYKFHNADYSKEFLNSYNILVEGILAARLLPQIIDIHSIDAPIVKNIIDLVK